MIVGLLGLGATLAGCGPSALQQRACEMWADEGGSTASLETWLAHFSRPEQAAEIGPAGDQWRTPQLRAQAQYEYGQQKNQEAKARVSRRLSISLREVDEALKKCPEAKPGAIQPRPN